MNKKSFNFRKNTLFAVLTAACLNGYAQQDSIKGKSSSKEEGNRNVMLNAASANGSISGAELVDKEGASKYNGAWMAGSYIRPFTVELAAKVTF